MFKRMDRNIEYCDWLDALGCHLNSLTIVKFAMVFSVLCRDYDLLQTYKCTNHKRSIPSAAETGAGPSGESTGSEILSPGLKIGILPTDGNLGDESVAEKSTNTRCLWGESHAALKPVVVSPSIALSKPPHILRHRLSELPQDTSFPRTYLFSQETV